MTEKFKQIIKEEVGKLPKEIQETINSLDWIGFTEQIGKKYLLSESKINDLQAETLLILVGLENGSSYALNIERNVGISETEAQKIAAEANQKIFALMRATLEENIKKNLKNKNIRPEDNINFILSGGNYSVFASPAETENEKTPPKNAEGLADTGAGKILGTKSIQGTKNKLVD